MEKKYIKTGVKILIRKSGKILLGKRLDKVGHGQWGLPGGHLEYGESIVSAAKRELLEETGLIVDNLKFINVTNIPRKDTHYIQFVFLAKGIHGQPQVKELDSCEQWEWFSPNKLPKPIFFGHQKLLQAVLHKQLLSD